MYIWKPEMWTACSTRASCGGSFSRSGRRSPTVWKCTGKAASLATSQTGFHWGIPERHDVVRVCDLETAHAAAFDHPPHLFHGGLDRGVGDAGKTRVAVRVRVAEAGEPLVGDLRQLDGG